MTLPDPRPYALVQSKNKLVRLTSGYLAGENTQAQLADGVRLWLDLQTDDGIGAALSLSANQAAYKTLFQAVLDELGAPVAGESQRALVFALPIVLVAGIKGKLQLPGRLPDIGAVKALLTKHGVIRADSDVYLSGKLQHLDDLSAIRPSQLQQWKSALRYASGGLPLELKEEPMLLDGEAVFLRFLVGVAMQPNDGEPAIRLNGDINSWGMPLTHLLGEQLGRDGLTLFAIPRPPQLLPAALQQGYFARQEVHMQVTVSNMLRKLRTAGETPVATLAAHEGGELRLTISSQENRDNWQGFVWPLSPLDNIELICQNFRQLMVECHVDDVRIIDTVQPAQHLGLPLFLTAHDQPIATSQL